MSSLHLAEPAIAALHLEPKRPDPPALRAQVSKTRRPASHAMTESLDHPSAAPSVCEACWCCCNPDSERVGAEAGRARCWAPERSGSLDCRTEKRIEGDLRPGLAARFTSCCRVSRCNARPLLLGVYACGTYYNG